MSKKIDSMVEVWTICDDGSLGTIVFIGTCKGAQLYLKQAIKKGARAHDF